MQSTGHTSTHALSLTLMHGSTITYGIGYPLCGAERVVVRPRSLYMTPRTLSTFRGLSAARWALGAISAPRVTEERHGFAGARRTLGAWGPSRAAARDRGAPRLRRGATSVG